VFAGDVVVDGVPIPEDAKIVPTGQNINESERRFLGAWAGTWAGDRRHVLIVEEVRSGGDARVIYAVANCPPNRTPAAWSRHEAKIADRTLTITAPTFAATYELTPSGALKAAGQRGDVRGNGKLWRADLGTLMSGRASIAWTALKSEFLDTSLREDGKAVRLEVVLFRPPGSGPFPLFVFNHGSTGSGRHPELFTETRWNFAIADFFMEKDGWSPFHSVAAGVNPTDNTTKASRLIAPKATPVTPQSRLPAQPAHSTTSRPRFPHSGSAPM
jgi:hypothetical protein